MSPSYDLALFEQLNDDYRERPVFSPGGGGPYKTRVLTAFEAPDWTSRVPGQQERRALSEEALERLARLLAEPVSQLTTRSETERQRTGNKLRPVLADIQIAGRDVLELGCGNGWLTEALVGAGQATSAIGIDVGELPSWAAHRDPRLRFLAGDLSAEELVAPESVDVVVSSVVFEHVTRPLQMLQALHRVLKPGGNAWLRFNLYRARNASHRYRDVFFPWPHLLFENDVCAAFYAKHHGRAKRFSWVNKMTIAHYLQASRDAGFDIDVVRLTRTPIDVEFYVRCEDKLGQYPALDLETDFMTMVMTKNVNPSGDVPSVGYVDAQLALDHAVADHVSALAS